MVIKWQQHNQTRSLIIFLPWFWITSHLAPFHIQICCGINRMYPINMEKALKINLPSYLDCSILIQHFNSYQTINRSLYVQWRFHGSNKNIISFQKSWNPATVKDLSQGLVEKCLTTVQQRGHAKAGFFADDHDILPKF